MAGIAWKRGEPPADDNPLPNKLIDGVTGQPVDWAALFSSISVSVDVGDIDLGSISIKDGTTADVATVDASGRLHVDGSGVTQPVSAASLPLPSGAATEASLTSIVSALGDIVTNTTDAATLSQQIAQQSALEDIVTATETIVAQLSGELLTSNVSVGVALSPAPSYATLIGFQNVLGQLLPVTETDAPLPVTGSVTATITGSDGSSGSTTIAAAATAQDLFSGATPTNGYMVVNPDANEIMWINEGADAAPNGTGCIPIFPLGGYETPPLYKPFGRVSVVAATMGHKVTARKW